MIGAITLLLVFQLAGEIIAQGFALPIPGPVIGMALLFAALALRGGPSGKLRGTAQGLLQHLSLLFVPATVALAIPLYAQLDRLRRMALPLLAALLVGSLTAALSAVVIGALLGASRAVQLSLATKSVTTPIAMGIAERLGGLPSLTAVLVITTGILGAVGARYIFRVMRIEDDAVRGFAMGIASHGIGTARAFQESEQTGAFAALAMGLNGLMTALLLPVVMPWVVS
jgi:putative effector of murein hydrolase